MLVFDLLDGAFSDGIMLDSHGGHDGAWEEKGGEQGSRGREQVEERGAMRRSYPPREQCGGGRAGSAESSGSELGVATAWSRYRRKKKEIFQGAPCLQVLFYYILVQQAIRNLIGVFP